MSLSWLNFDLKKSENVYDIILIVRLCLEWVEEERNEWKEKGFSVWLIWEKGKGQKSEGNNFYLHPLAMICPIW